MEDQLEEFGDRVRARRKELRLTQLELAERVGCSQSTIGQIENGRNRTFREIVTLARELETTPGYLIDGYDLSVEQGEIEREVAIGTEMDIETERVYEQYLHSGYANIAPLQFNHYRGVSMLKFKQVQSGAFLPKTFIEKLNTSNLKVVDVDNNDMAPLIPTGAMVIVDISKKEMKEGAVFLIERNAEMIMRRIGIDRDGSWMYKCDNTTRKGQKAI